MLKESEFVKLRIIIPVGSGDLIREVLGKNGAGVQGNYSYCSNTFKVQGRFLPMAGAHPAIGEIGKLEEVDEEIIETLCHRDLVEKVISEVKKAHPYEEPAIDIIPRIEF